MLLVEENRSEGQENLSLTIIYLFKADNINGQLRDEKRLLFTP